MWPCRTLTCRALFYSLALVTHDGAYTALSRDRLAVSLSTLSLSLSLARAQVPSAEKRLAALLTTQAGVAGVRLGMVNDWGSHTGFSYTLGFVLEGDVEKSDERIDLENGGALYIERKALWVGEGGLVGATLDIDEEFNLIITPKDGRTPSGYN